ncbi:MAG: T9SS type A sorting domain-containing protein [Bacteroidia bacterium]|nr:T9SS type A sorting domain-containing protein [Bacteroidia bacterium]
MLFLSTSLILGAQSGEMTRDDLEEFGPKGNQINPTPAGQTGEQTRAGAVSLSTAAGEYEAAKTMACGTSLNLVAPYNTNNGQRGCMFDVHANTTLTVRCFDVNLYSGTTAPYEVYYHAGTFVGSENNAGAWTLLGTAAAVTSLGNNVPTPLPINFSVIIPAGATYSFYVTNTSGGGTSYTDGAAVGNFLAGDANMTVYEGVGKSYPFGLTFTVRKFNGTINYDLGGALDLEAPALALQAFADRIDLSWPELSSQSAKKYELRRSENGIDFTSLATFNPGQTQFEYSDRTAETGLRYWYQLVVSDQNGNQVASNAVSGLIWDANIFQVEGVFPNPFADGLSVNLNLRERALVGLKVMDLRGKILWQEAQALSEGPHRLQPDLSALNAGLYLLQVNAGGQQETLRIRKE